MDGKEDSLCTDGNSFSGLHSHHVCNEKPPDKAGAFSWLRRNHTNQENREFLSFNFLVIFWAYGIVTLEALKSFAFDFYGIIVIQTSFITWLKSQHHIEILKYRLLKATLEFENHFDEHHIQK